jgi:hypothetical protein
VISLYDCTVVHARTWPKAHRLAYRFFWFAIELTQTQTQLPAWGLVGTGRISLYRFKDDDHLCIPGSEGLSLAAKLSQYLEVHGIHWNPSEPGARAVLVTQLRFLGYVFNPVSFYYCFRSDGSPVAAVAEVGNTFGEMKLYPMGPKTLINGEFRLRVPKYFYVSPFTDLTTEFEFRLPPPSDRLIADVDDFKDGKKILIASLYGQKKMATTPEILKHTLRFPLVTFQIIFLIHWNALLLLLKGTPYFKKSSNPNDQREVLKRT